jgi:hypothetical protein
MLFDTSIQRALAKCATSRSVAMEEIPDTSAATARKRGCHNHQGKQAHERLICGD